jgi:hypothetical protein
VALAVEVCNNRIKLVMFGRWTQPVTRDSAPNKVPPSGGSMVCILRFLVLVGALVKQIVNPFSSTVPIYFDVFMVF